MIKKSTTSNTSAVSASTSASIFPSAKPQLKLIILLIFLHIFALIALFLNHGPEFLSNLSNLSNFSNFSNSSATSFNHESLIHGFDFIHDRIFIDIRLPQLLASYFVGALLALMGYLLHTLSQNTLIETHILGVSAASNLGGLICLAIFPITNIPPIYGAFLLALIACVFLFKQPKHLLLRGVMLGTVCGALITLILQLADHQNLPGLLFWLMGDLSRSTWRDVGLLAFILLALLYFIYHSRQRIAYLWLGTEKAASLDMNTKRLEFQFFILIAGISAFLSLTVGGIGFIGFLVPHFIYLWAGRLGVLRHTLLLVLLGGSLLAVCQHLSRILLYPSQLPVGILTAILGVPIFLWALKQARHHS